MYSVYQRLWHLVSRSVYLHVCVPKFTHAYSTRTYKASLWICHLWVSEHQPWRAAYFFYRWTSALLQQDSTNGCAAIDSYLWALYICMTHRGSGRSYFQVTYSYSFWLIWQQHCLAGEFCGMVRVQWHVGWSRHPISHQARPSALCYYTL